MGRDPGVAVLLDGLTFPEAPRWHAGRLWFSDFYSHRVIAVDPRRRSETIANVYPRPSGLGWRPMRHISTSISSSSAPTPPSSMSPP